MTTTVQLQQMLRDDEKARRRARTEQGRGPVQRTKRQRNKKAFHKGQRQSWKRDI